MLGTRQRLVSWSRLTSLLVARDAAEAGELRPLTSLVARDTTKAGELEQADALVELDDALLAVDAEQLAHVLALLAHDHLHLATHTNTHTRHTHIHTYVSTCCAAGAWLVDTHTQIHTGCLRQTGTLAIQVQ